MFATFVTLFLGVVVVFALQRGRAPAESRVVWAGYAGHIAASFGQYAITAYWYGGGDMFYYLRTGEQIAVLLSYSPDRVVPELVGLFFHEPAQLPVDLSAAFGSTGSMVAIATVLLYFLGGSWLAACIALSTAAYVSRVGLLRVFLQELPSELHGSVRLAVLLLPSVTFWGATVAKETMVLIGLGPLAAVARRLADPARLVTRAWLVPVALLAAGLIWEVKPYVLVAFVAAAGVWWLTRTLQRSGRKLTRAQLALGALASIAAVIGVGRVLPEYSLDAIAERAADLQAVGAQIEGGSGYQLGSAGERSVLGQAAFVPMALVYSLFRPFLFEVRNPLMLVNALETTWITLLVLQNLRRGRLAGLIATARESPIMAFSLAFVVLVGVGVGLATTNLGTLTRYRMPMMAFYAAFLIVWYERCKPAPAASRAPVVRRPRRWERGPALPT